MSQREIKHPKSTLATSQRAIAAAKLCRASGMTARNAATLVGVSHATVYAALHVLDLAAPDVVAAITDGEMSVTRVDEELRAASAEVHRRRERRLKAMPVPLDGDLYRRFVALRKLTGVTLRDLVRLAADAWLSVAERGSTLAEKPTPPASAGRKSDPRGTETTQEEEKPTRRDQRPWA